MAERYQRRFTLPANEYAPGSPVLIAAGALLLDTQTGGVLAQLKLQNLGAKPVKSVKVAVSPLDPAGRALGEPVTYQYLDLSVARDGMFGQKSPIRLPDPTARSFTAAVTEVIFADSTLWTADAEAVWAPLAASTPLNAALGDPELVKQYQLRHGADAVVQPERIGDLWRCACGAMNRAGEASCHLCGRSIDALLATDMAALEREKNERLEAERKAREAKEAADREAAEQRKTAAAAAAKKTKKILKIAVPVLIAVIAAALVITKVVIPNSNYSKAVKLMEAGKYDEAISAFEKLGDYKDSEKKIAEAETGKAVAKAEALEKDGKTAEAAMAYGALIDVAPEYRERSFALWNEIAQRSTVVASDFQTVALRTDGTVVAAGSDSGGKRAVSRWTDIVSVAAGHFQIVGLRADGTVVAAGSNNYGQCDVDGWTDIVAIAAGDEHTVGLRADGTVVATGNNEDGRCDVSDWTGVVAIAADTWHTVGLRADGTVVATGDNERRQCNVSDWTDIVAIHTAIWNIAGLNADGTVRVQGQTSWDQCNVYDWHNIVAVAEGFYYTVGLREDGTVVATGNNEDGQCEVSDWTDIIAISTNGQHTVGLRADGTVVATGDNANGKCDVEDWTDVVAIFTSSYHTVGLRADGTVVATGYNEQGQCDVSGWKDIKLPDSK